MATCHFTSLLALSEKAQFLHILISIWYGQSFSILSILNIKVCSSNSFVVSTCISLMTNDVEYLFTTCQLLLVSCSSLLSDCLVQYFVHFFPWVICFPNEFSEFFLYILDTNPLSNICFAKTCSQSWTCFSFSQQCVLKRERFQCFFF